MTNRWTRMTGFSAAALVGCASIWISSGFTRGEREPLPPSPAMKVDDGAIALTPDAPQWQLLKLGVVQPAVMRWTDPVPARVQIDETRASKIQVPLSGRVTDVFVELGQRVKEGDPLFSVASPEIADLRAEREKAAVDLEVARSTLERTQALVASRALPAKEELLARQQFEDAEVSMKLAGAKLDSLRVSSKEDNAFTVTAPRAGVLVEKNVLIGQSVAPDAGSSLMVVADLSSVWVVADLFEAQATGVKEGAGAEVTSPSLPDSRIGGKVAMVSAVVDPSRHTVPIRVSLPNPEGALRPNVYARVRFSTVQRSGAVEIPATALITDGDRQYVYVQSRPGRFSRREIVAGPVREGRVPVLSGLAAGETIVHEGGVLLDNQLSLGT
jgi:cobalt-zinc-cadmium efflux system membrane fusion protein